MHNPAPIKASQEVIVACLLAHLADVPFPKAQRTALTA